MASSDVQFSWTASKYTMQLGKSTTPPSLDDIDIETGRKASSAGTVQLLPKKVIITATFTNSSAETQSYTEIGLFITGDSSYGILVARSVFDKPVVIPAGESKSFTITLDMNKLADSVSAS